MGEQRAVPSSFNNFQGRYIMLNEWEGEVSCEDPVRGRWGGPPNGGAQKTTTAEQDPLVKRDAVKLDTTVKTVDFLPRRLADAIGQRTGEDQGAKASETKGSVAEAPRKDEPEGAAPPSKDAPTTQSGCAQAGGQARLPSPGAVLILLGALAWRRRRRV